MGARFEDSRFSTQAPLKIRAETGKAANPPGPTPSGHSFDAVLKGFVNYPKDRVAALVKAIPPPLAPLGFHDRAR